MKCLVVTTDRKMYPKDFGYPIRSNSVSKVLGGYMEIVRPMLLKRPYCILVNDEGRIRNLPINEFGTFLYQDIIAGNLILAKEELVDGERDIIGLDDKELDGLIKRLADTIELVKEPE